MTLRGRQYGAGKHKPSRRERAPESEAAETTRRNREWLRERDDDDVPDWRFADCPEIELRGFWKE